MGVVFPTPVGVFPNICPICHVRESLPHARGGVSTTAPSKDVLYTSSPRPWGCFSRLRRGVRPRGVFPTPVGVFPSPLRSGRSASGLPHARGGVSAFALSATNAAVSSPRPWGCFPRRVPDARRGRVFPTPVGVFLDDFLKATDARSLPHARGGVSGPNGKGVEEEVSSPRPWGCFFQREAAAGSADVFPTPVGVFPISPLRLSARKRLPHARGGVST